ASIWFASRRRGYVDLRLELEDCLILPPAQVVIPPDAQPGQVAGEIGKPAQLPHRGIAGGGGGDAGSPSQLLVADVERNVDPYVEGEVERLVRRERRLHVGGNGRTGRRRILLRVCCGGGIRGLFGGESCERE